MLNKRLNPFVAILALTIIGATGTLFVVHKIFETDFIYANTSPNVGLTAADLLKQNQ
ncbi:MAG TPA: hypothetical protein VN086_01055 [Candidatus Paceibacterota bacterium]|nr:hypothetical protein [Candidatus Paceibacterota bacterium]